MRRYKGKRPCPGCGTPGEEKPRSGAREICWDCKKALKLGKDLQENDDGRYGTISLDGYTAKEINMRLGKNDRESGEDIPYVNLKDSEEFNSKTLQKALLDFMDSLDVGKRPHDSVLISLHTYDASRTTNVTVPLEQAKMFFRFWKQVCGFASMIKYNAFLSGTDLLRGLNSGDITLDDFEQRIDNAEAKLQ